MPPAQRADLRAPAPGSRIAGKYRLIRRIAEGGMGDVWMALNETTEAKVALKVLRPGKEDRARAEERFRREAKLGGLLAHRSIVRIFDFLEEPDGSLVLVMELLRGETLEHRIKSGGPMSSRAAVAILGPVLSALQHGHDHGVIHRDVKPANIFLAAEPDGREVPKLLDFGIAKMPRSTGTKTIDGMVLGTPSYMSPEQIHVEDIDGRSDLFSLGVVLYELCTGTCPFEAKAPSAAIAAVLTNEVDPDPRIDPRVWLEIRRALSKRPSERHASAAEMATALYAALGETEDSLAPELRRSRPLIEVDDAIPARGATDGHTQSVEGQSVGVVRRRSPAWTTWAALGGIACVAIVALAVRGGGHAAPVSDPASASASALASASASASAPVSALASAPAAPPTTPAPIATAPASKRPQSSPHHTPRRRPLATTPGF